MNKFAEFVVGRRKLIILFFAIAVVASIFMSMTVDINYNLSKYLPEDMESKRSLSILEEEFGLTSSARVMVPNVDIAEARTIKEEISCVDGVASVVWADDVIDTYQPEEFIDPSVMQEYYKDAKALFLVNFSSGDYDPNTGNAIDEIKRIVGDEGSIYGPASTGKEIREVTLEQMTEITVILVPIIIIVLLLATTSYFEPVLFLIVVGVSILLNLGTNAFIGEVSFATQSMTTALQLAISMDYSIFLLHRFGEERKQGLNVEEAMKNAIKKSFSSVSASAMTTVMGFLALLFMQFKIGTDMGLVFSKGIILSLLCVMVLLPPVAIIFSKAIERTHHRSLMPSFKSFGRLVYKFRYASMIIVVLLIVPSFLAQQSNDFVYGGSTISDSEESDSYRNKVQIEEAFGPFNPTVVLVPSYDISKEVALSNELMALQTVVSVQSLSSLVDTRVPEEMLPAEVVSQFKSGNYSRMIVTLSTEEEGEEAFCTIEQMREICQKYYPDEYGITGATASTYDIKTAAGSDYTVVNLLAILAVMLILIATFRSVILAAALVFSIEAAIFINMAIPYFSGNTLSYIGFMVVSAIQLGATIDYAILLTNRYLENRKKFDKRESCVRSIEHAGGSILTSAGILCIAGFVIGNVSSIATVSELGILLGRGALLSLLMVFMFLPSILVSLDRVIKKRFQGKSEVSTAAGKEFTP